MVRLLCQVGGSDERAAFGDVWTYCTKTGRWAQLSLKGTVNLLQRTAHQAVLYSGEPDSILVHAGYALGEDSDRGEWLSDFVIINTAKSESCPLPECAPILIEQSRTRTPWQIWTAPRALVATLTGRLCGR